MPFTNRLAEECSPYLKQHAHNPVDWYPWGQAALDKALKENKPILLSIGYAACHWCHVMAHESFEDSETATLMNELFINIKVDREERPDLDKIYQTTHYLLTQQGGGWPLTVFLTPQDLIPFFSGTYFPKETRYHLPAFKEVLQSAAKAYHERQEDISKQSTDLMQILRQEADTHENFINDKPIALAIYQLKAHFDNKYGGFGHAPKFPQAPKLAFLMRNHPSLCKNTLSAMAAGGIFDQLAGGFYRYSVDEKWRIPHFEKMLYDNGQLLALYAQTASLYPDMDFEKTAKETAAWILNEMQEAKNGYFSSLDADSEGHEGLYYVWDKSEIKSLLTTDEFALLSLYFGLNEPANFENTWHFFIAKPLSEAAEELHLSLTQAETLLTSAKTKLLERRKKRTPPSLDKKILTSWNSLTIKGMMIAAIQLNDMNLMHSAKAALTFLHKKLWVNQRLLASYHEGKATLPAYLDDYAFLSDALLTALQISWETKYLHFLQDLLSILLQRFYDKEKGGFYFTADNHEELLYRPKTMMDEAIPNGNGITVQVLFVLGHLLNETAYINAAEKTLQAAWPALHQYPAEHTSLLAGLAHYLTPPEIIVIRGPKTDVAIWQSKVKTANNFVFAIPDDEIGLPSALADKKLKGKICAYVCKGTECKEVIDDLSKL